MDYSFVYDHRILQPGFNFKSSINKQIPDGALSSIIRADKLVVLRSIIFISGLVIIIEPNNILVLFRLHYGIVPLYSLCERLVEISSVQVEIRLLHTQLTFLNIFLVAAFYHQ